ncbi:retropepsin-like aspartic protease family protein [Arhodomonas sp. AD133]|uniref:retropepsin-like aspartic protease family protein n=1 Tax=Arhodomonas sp. AD133 TaxID=3415009 RepID=UPI003EBDB89D
MSGDAVARWGRALAMLSMLAFAVTALATPRIVVLAVFPGKVMLEVDGERTVLAEGETGPAGVRLVKASSDQAVVEVDGERRRLGVNRMVGGEYAPTTRRQARIAPGARGSYHTAGRINGHGVRFLVDTGADLVAIDAGLARRLGIDYRSDGVRMRVSTAGGATRGWRVQLARVRVGEVVVRNVPALVLEGGVLRQPLLGMSFLGRVSLRHDGRVLVIEQRP